jgi:membrane associated rhomboid family serine protease
MVAKGETALCPGCRPDPGHYQWNVHDHSVSRSGAIYGKRLLALNFIPGVLGEIFGYLWRPAFAGSSLGIAGVMGSLFAFTFSRRNEVSKRALLFAVAGIAAGSLCALTAIHTVRRFSLVFYWPA